MQLNKKKMETLKIRTAEEIQDLTFNVAGFTLSTTSAISLKIYGNGATYIKGKKVFLSDEDIQELENAQAVYFLYSANEEKQVWLKEGLFFTSKFGHGEYGPKNLEEIKEILAASGIEIIQ